ncbi:hypothetical protein HA402_001311 [Bradysia odoriphaga]|nr:hypothetical protein HA402_001311 [Bradysia odoriphaga]
MENIHDKDLRNYTKKEPQWTSYEGDFHKEKRHGTGRSVYRDGSVYDGEWKSDSKDGFGLMTHPDGSTYEGEWKNNSKHGYGVYIYPNGDKYEGQWYADLRHGIGTYTHIEDDCSFHGTWCRGQRIGPAEIRSKNYRFHTNWTIDRPVGESAFTFNCDTMMTGFMDVADGTGVEENGDFQWYAQDISKYDPSKLPAAPSIHQFVDHLDDELLHELKNASDEASGRSVTLEHEKSGRSPESECEADCGCILPHPSH